MFSEVCIRYFYLPYALWMMTRMMVSQRELSVKTKNNVRNCTYLNLTGNPVFISFDDVFEFISFKKTVNSRLFFSRRGKFKNLVEVGNNMHAVNRFSVIGALITFISDTPYKNYTLVHTTFPRLSIGIFIKTELFRYILYNHL